MPFMCPRLSSSSHHDDVGRHSCGLSNSHSLGWIASWRVPLHMEDSQAAVEDNQAVVEDNQAVAEDTQVAQGDSQVEVEVGTPAVAGDSPDSRGQQGVERQVP
eukprot:CAMPEP_0117012012 /NCGR_PEP_ID=MMETSP0472-20121206/10206_1 /TAXON_ID=693140 ORGANISM="Tiarina fusus, Strain LIS" /NCGR_SAMPLE_ID=MMETSP0472 /ASSEMBLY_ACC=CAM_ASM_000603 /LENGTH=102 /DNA_ID=CAMNT_0004714983 /DNA_START=321 /DNA_END=629 /DNA_ORIENTATION=+